MRKTAFTLIEVMIAILIVSIIMLGGFSALSAVTVGKVKLIEKTNIEKEAFYFSEKLFEMIKKWWTLDYEEYWNRKIIGDTTYDSGHYDRLSWFGNFWEWVTIPNTSYGRWFYYCLSGSGSALWNDGCVTNNNTHSVSAISSLNYTNSQQRYGQYALQFIDFNINADSDLWDEDNDGSIIGDDDDEYLGEWPEVFGSGSGVPELYLISGDKKSRTYFRYQVIADPDAPTWATCNSTNGGRTYTGSGCLGTIQFLQLQGKDWWIDHTATSVDADGTQYDGRIDTWVIDPKFHTGSTDIIAGSNNTNYWENLFPETIHVSDFEVYAYPNKNRGLAWKENTQSVNISPYIRITLKLQSSWKKRKLIQWKAPTLDFSTSISLTDLYSK